MRHRTLHIAATLLAVLAWIVGVVIAAAGILIGLQAVTGIAAAGIILGGFIIGVLSAIMLLAVSRLILLLIDIESHLAKIAGNTDKKGD
jgi:hypothetical protein